MPNLSRRQLLKRAGGALAASALDPQALFAQNPASPGHPHGVVSGQPAAEKVGARVLADGGNAVDAIIAAALTAAVAAPHHTGIGGYGGHLTLALAKAAKVTCIDFNSAAPAAARDDLFALDASGKPRNAAQWGWLAAGVPGILAGMQLALDRYGTRGFRESVAPAIELARGGIRYTATDVTRLKACSKQFGADEGSRKLYLGENGPIAGAETFRNPDLAAMLTTLAERNSVDAFYRGDIAQQIADAFKKNNGLVSAEDLAAYRAREVEPLSLTWQGFDIRTAPLTAGGLTVLQSLAILRALEWEKMAVPGFTRTHAQIEAFRFAWNDRLRLFGDPEQAAVPVAKVLSDEYAREAAGQVQRAVKAGTILPWPANPRKEPGTIHLSAVDRHGNMAACTLTHGGTFGARVTVDGLGLTLGHGMSRFDPHPGHPNAPGPGKRPLHNMCPTIVLRDGQPVLALGARGGRQIPNAVAQVLAHFAGLGQDMTAAVAVPRFHTEGTATVLFEKAWPASETEAAQRAGYQVKTSTSATISAVSFDPKTGDCRAALR